MAAVTALQLVNRLLVRLKYDEAVNFDAENATLALELVNTAMDDLLASRDYPWNVRSDGVLNLKPTISGTNTASMADANTFLITSFSGSLDDVTGNFVTRLLITDDTSFAGVGVYVQNAALLGTTLSLNLTANYPNPSVVNGDWKLFFAEYLLPDTVGKVLSVRNQGEPVRLVEVEPHAGFDEWMPRPQDTEDGSPQVVGVGGTAVGTYQFNIDEDGNHRLRLMVWPIPTAVVQLHYSYKERFDPLSEVTDTRHAPTEFFDDVVNRAEAMAYSGAWQNDPALAQLLLQNSVVFATQKYANSRLDPQRRHVVRALDAAGSRRTDPTKYRDVGSL